MIGELSVDLLLMKASSSLKKNELKQALELYQNI